MWLEWLEFPDYIRIMTRMSARSGTNKAEYAENATELPEFATESMHFGQIWTEL